MKRPARLSTALLLSSAVGLSGQSTGGAPAGAFLDPGAYELVSQAFDRRRVAVEGLESYETRFTERMRVGLGVGGGIPIRDRTLYHREQVGWARWSSDGSHVVRWLGRRKGSPTFGDSWLAGRIPFDIDFDPESELGLDELGAIEFFDPDGERLDLFDAEFIQPISSTGMQVYTFESGDTLRLRLAAPDRSLELIEVKVVPRYDSWETVEGSLWFDRETGVLVRAAYRPTAPWDFAEQQPHDLEGVPFFVRPARGTVEHIVIEYALYEQRWWLPRRVLGEGVFRWGNGFMRMPLQIEWTMGTYTVNEAPTENTTPQAGDRRAGRDRFQGQEITYYAPDGVDLSSTPDLPEPLAPDAPLNFTGDELSPLLDRIDEVGGPLAPPAPVDWRRHVLESLRYNRVHALSVGYLHTSRVGEWGIISLEGRVGTAAPEPSVSVGLERGRWSLGGYTRLVDAVDFDDGFGFANGLSSLLFGQDDGEYFRATGAELELRFGGRGGGLTLRAFGERHDAVAQETGFSFGSLGGGGFRPNIAADEIDVVGLGWEGWRQIGDDVQRGLIHLRTWGEGGGGDHDYLRAAAGIRATGPVWKTSFAVDLAGGAASDDVPVQRRFFLGGTRSLRGFAGGEMSGRSFWLARFEGASRTPGLRGLGFVDVGWAGPRTDFFHSQPRVSVGAGLSVMDGLFRIDVGRGVVRGGEWRVHFYADGIF